MKKFIQIPENREKICIASFEFASAAATKVQNEDLIKLIDELTNGAVKIEWNKERIQIANSTCPYEIKLYECTLYLYKIQRSISYWECTSNCENND